MSGLRSAGDVVPPPDATPPDTASAPTARDRRARLPLVGMAVLTAAAMVLATLFAFGVTVPGAVRDADGGQDRPIPDPVTTGDSYMLIERAQLMRLPMSSRPWDEMLRVADEDLGTPALADQDDETAARVVAAALVYARSGQTSYRDRVISTLRELPDAPLDGARVLSVGRQLAGYVIAADLVGFREDAFLAFARDIRTRDLGNHGRWRSLVQTSEDSASNWGAWALSSRIALSAYVGDDADLGRAAQVFRGFTGDRDAYAGFSETGAFDATWACDPDRWIPINSAYCGDRSGAIVEDISRSSGTYPSVSAEGIDYSWETLAAASLSATLLSRALRSDVWQWGDQALLRAAQFLHRNEGYLTLHRHNNHAAWAINSAYDITLGPIGPAGHGRAYGYTDWLFPPTPS